MLGLDGYVRVSRVGGREGEGYISPDVQREAIAAYAAELGGEIVAWHDDQDFSGGNIDRPGFQAALERLRAGESDGIVVMRVDRFARSVADGAAIVREIVGRDQVFAACHERIDPRTPEGTFMLNSFLNNAELFLNQSKASWWTAKNRAVARGAHIGPTPIGYNRIPKGQQGSGRLIPHPVYGPAITELFHRAAGGIAGDTALARWMTEQAPREAGREWQASEIRRWLSNRVYLGEVHYGQLVNEAAHEALTDSETWAQCQRDPGTQRRAHSTFLLRGLIRCASCRYAMSGQTYGGAGQTTPVYRCIGRGACAEPSVIVARSLEDYVTGMIRDQLRGLSVTGVAGDADIDRVSREAREAEAELAAFASDLEARRLLGEAGWREALGIRAAERDSKVTRRDDVLVKHRHTAIALRVDELGEHELRDLLAMVRHVFIRRRPRGADVAERALIVWADDTRSIDVPGPHRSGPFEPIRW